jgi:ABC-type Mn2+/Zn2+ transport system ATPase subunit/ABC-type Zn uptake system ZnuABC Zn-binding protein ZnuA
LRKLALLFLCILLCQGTKANVVCTTTIIADMAKNLAPTGIEVISLLPVGADPHIYEPTTADAQTLAKATLVLKNGLHLEGWLDKVIQATVQKAPVVAVTDGINPISAEGFEKVYDPHAWMTPFNGKIYITNIATALRQAYPSFSSEISRKETEYLGKLNSVEKEVERLVATIPPKKRLLLTTHDAFRYFANAYGFQVASVLGNSTDADVLIEDVNRLISLIKNRQIPVVFVEATINPKLLTQIATDTRISVGKKLFSDSIGDSTSAAPNYLSLLLYNTQAISEGLTEDTAIQAGMSPDLVLLITTLGIFLLSTYWLAYKLRRSALPESLHELTLEINDISVSYEGKIAVSNINLYITGGKVVGLIGANGSGKSTLMKTICGLLTPESGSITINQLSPNRYLPLLAYLPQKEEIDWQFPATAFDIVLMGMYGRKKTFESINQQDKEEALSMMKKLEIDHFRNRQISELSGGQQQRVFLARALCQQTPILLMDEPFVGVDMATEQKIIQIIKEMASQGKLVIIVHHDLSKVPRYFDETILLNRHLIAFGKTEEVFTKENIAKTFGAKLNILDTALNLKPS